VFALLGFIAVWGEAAYGLVLVWPASRRVLPAMMGLMHVGIVFLQNILFLDLVLFQFLFVDFTRVRRWLGRWAGAPLELVYDGACARCRRTAEVLHRLDLFERLRLVDRREAPPSTVGAVPTGPWEHSRAVRGRALAGRVARALPLGWLVLPLLWVPGMGTLASRAAARMMSALASDGTCTLHGPPAPGRVVRAALATPVATRRAPLAVAALAAFMLTIWAHEVEFFPLTALQMYSQPVWRSHDPLITYRVLAVRESGEASRAAWDEVVGPYRRNARFRAFLWNYFDSPAQAERLRRFMTAAGDAWNRTAPAGRRVTRMEAQAWESMWDDPRAGRLVDRLAVELAPAVAAPGGAESRT
jgi:hypothetical protein